VTVTLRFGDEDVTLEVIDDGCGFEAVVVAANGAGHLGLRSMRHRAESLGGHIGVESRLGLGTAVRAVVPIS
jgi:signal transduction histidine kinase